ncbi:MAG: alpha/beta fold hydrolase [Sphingopyxis sp.]|nr:alpha/beta fold hydrolase [Sphingopyxis sp.]
MNVGSSADAIWAILPGLLCDSRMFGVQLAALPGAICIDGFYGGADRIEAMADHALARLPAKVSLLGHSMGARVALEIVRRAPERVERLILADTGIHPVRPGEREKRYALRDLGREQGMAALVDAWLPPMMTPAHRAHPALFAPLRSMSIDAGIAIYEAQIEALLHRPLVDDLLPAIACPTLAIVGAEDLWSPLAQHEDIQRRIPGAELRVVPRAGHMAPAENPQEFTNRIREWIGLTAA